MNQNFNINFDNLSIDDLKTVMVKIYKGASQEEVLEATVFLKAYASRIQSVPVFVKLLTQDPISEIRLLSAIILKKHIAQHLSSMAPEDKSLLQNGLLERYFEEHQKRVQRSSAALIASLLKNCFEERQNWTDPLVLVSQKTKPDQSEGVRTQGFLLLSTILEVNGENLSSFYEDLFKFFLETINDPSANIRKQTMLCVLNMYTSVSEESLVFAFNQIYPLLLECFYQSIKENDEDTIEKSLEMFCALTQKKNVVFDNEKISKLVELFCLPEALLSKDLNPLFRETMIDIILNIVVSYKTVVSKNEAMLRKVIEIIFTLACIKEPKDELQDRDPLQDVALNFIQQAAVLLPKKKAYPIFKEYLLKMFEANNDDVIEGGFLVLGHLAEGCCEYLRRDLSNLMKNFIKKGLDNSNEQIKDATFYTINYFAEYLSPDVIMFHPMILPPLIKNLENPDQKVLARNVISLEIFCREMTETIMQYLPELIPKLITLVDKPENMIPVKSRAILTISSCAIVAETNFAPYASQLLPLLAQLVNLTDKKFIELKSAAIKCIGNVVGNCLQQTPELFRSSVESLIPTIYEGLKSTENTILKRNCFEFFYNLAIFLKQDFRLYLQQIVELTFANIEQAKASQAERKPKVFSLDSDNEDENDPSINWVDDNIIEEMGAAICCLGEMAFACPSEYAPYYERTVTLIAELSQHFHYSIRMQSLLCYKNLTKALAKLGNNGELPKYTPGIKKYFTNKLDILGIPCAQRLSADVEQFLYDEVYKRLFFTLDNDRNIHLVITVLDILHEFCTDLGPAAVDQRLDLIIEQLKKVFSNKTLAQNEAFEGDEEIHGELFGTATVVVNLLIKTCRDGFIAYFDKLYPVLKKFVANDEISEDDVAEILATFGLATKYMTQASSIYGIDMLQVCIKALELGDEYVNNNLCYCVGLIIEYGKDKIVNQQNALAILEKLKQIYETSTLPETRDNAISAIARMVYANADVVPLNVIVPSLVKEMPLKADYKENRHLIKMLIFLFEKNVEILSGMEERCIELLIDAVIQRNKYKIKDENVIRAIGLILKNLSNNANAKQIIENCVSKLSNENVELLKQLLSA